jgi:putative phosphotransacetylase
MTIAEPMKFDPGLLNVEKMAQEVLRRLREKSNGTEPKPFSTNGGRAVQVPIGISVRHLHLCPEHVATLFGKDHQLQVFHELYQKGYYAAKEQVMVVGRKRCLEKVRVLGPTRPFSQVELAQSEAIALGLKLPVATSGNEPQTQPITLVGPAGIVSLPGGEGGGVFLARRHIHISDVTAVDWGVEEGDTLTLKIDGPRPVTFDDVLVRVKAGWRTEVHLDTDEGNACLIRTGQMGTLILP